MNNEQTLDDTLKELINETENTADTAEVTKPRRGRKPKAAVTEDPSVGDSTTEAASSEAEVAPTVIIDTALDAAPDITEVAESTEPAPAVLRPEIIEETEQDKLPDIETPKLKTTSTKKVVPAGEAYEAFEATEEVDSNSLVGKSFIIGPNVPLYRTASTAIQLKPYKGLLIIIADSMIDDGFVQVQFLRQGFGLCTGFISADRLPSFSEDTEAEEQ